MKNKVENIYKKAERFASLTKEFIMEGNIARAKKCLTVAAALFESGTRETRSVISAVYLHSVSIFMECHNCNIRDLFPDSLMREYSKQTNASGI